MTLNKDGAECSKKIVSGGKVAGAISPLINARGLSALRSCTSHWSSIFLCIQ